MRLIISVLLASFLSLGAGAKLPSTSDSDYNAALQCPSATVNYITQTLPQQCLRTDWTRPGSNGTEGAGITTAGNDGNIGGGGQTQEAGVTPTEVSSGPDFETTTAQASSSAFAGLPEQSAKISSEAVDEDGDPLSDHANFLSFEEWKAQMLEKAGQSPDHIVGAATGPGSGEHRRRQGAINNALDSLGDEGEIEIDFSGFVNSETTPESLPNPPRSRDEPVQESQDETPTQPVKRSKEAGTTSKERFNYASFDCAATVLKNNQGSKGATWILSENKDSYLLNKCSEKSKYFIVELCNDILIDTIVLGNFEFFSSTFRTFRVSISDRYPVKADKWREIGTFEARNTRGVQAFMVEDGLFWARYLKVEFLTHYGSEYYCPVSLLRVHGTTMVDDWRSVMKESHDQDDEDADDPLLIGSGESEPAEVVPLPPIKTTEALAVEQEPSTSITTVSSETSESYAQDTVFTPTGVPQSESLQHTSSWTDPLNSSDLDELCNDSDQSSSDGEAATASITPMQGVLSIFNEPPLTPSSGEPGAPSSAFLESPETLTSSMNATAPVPTTQLATSNATSTVTSSPDVPAPTDAASISTIKVDGINVTPLAFNITQSLTTPETTPLSSIVSTFSQTQTPGKVEAKVQNVTASSTKSKSKQSSPIKASPATPSTQDSFFRAVHKRLQMLESNSTLSLQYIEEQSRILRDAFTKAEKKQLQKTADFLETLNSTVLGELRDFRAQYDQIWQSTVLELSSQREQNQKEIRVLGERLGLLANQVVWQQRVSFAQLLLIILCLGMVLFSKNGVAIGATAPLDITLLESIQHLRRGGASISFPRRYPSSMDSPPGTPSRPTSMGAQFNITPSQGRELSDGMTSGDEIPTDPTSSPEQHRKSNLHLRTSSDGTTLVSGGRSKSPSVSFGPMTPASEQEDALDTKTDTEGSMEVPEADPSALKRAASSPPFGRQFDTPIDDELSSAGGDLDINGRREIADTTPPA